MMPSPNTLNNSLVIANQKGLITDNFTKTLCSALIKEGNCLDKQHTMERCREVLAKGIRSLTNNTLQSLFPTCFTNSVPESTTAIAEPIQTMQQDPFTPDCHESRAEYSAMVKSFTFWIEGVGVCLTGGFGLIGNIITIIVLRRITHNKSFNNLLIGLSVSDILLIIVQVLEIPVIKVFLEYEPLWYRQYVPYFIHPVKSFIQNLAIYMVVAVSTERFKAVCNPLQKRQPYYKFIVVAVIMSVSLAIPRFFEFRLTHNNTDYDTTALMENPDYIQFNSYWNKLFAVGAFPLVSLSYMNFRIYLKIRSSSRFAQSFVSNTSTRKHQQAGNRQSLLSQRVDDVDPHRPPYKKATESGSLRNGTTRPFSMSPNTMEMKSMGSNNKGMRHSASLKLKRCSMLKRQFTFDTADLATMTNQESVGSDSINDRYMMNIKYIRKRREKSTIILVSIVVIFVISHTYHLALRLFEVTHPQSNTFENYQHCKSLGLYHIPVPFYINNNFHYLMIVFNSSINFIIYCCVAKDFRSQAYKWITRKEK